MGQEKQLENGKVEKSNSKDDTGSDTQCTASQCTKIVDVVALIVALVATVALFSLPIVFHFTLRYSGGTGITNSTSTVTNASSINTSCSSTEALGSWGEVSIPSSSPTTAPCSDTGYMYASDGVCNTYLRQWLKCTANVDSPDAVLFINGSDEQATRNSDINTLKPILDSQPSCRDAALPFLCQFYFPLRDCTTNTIYTASQETCLTISTSTCASLWQLGVSLFPDKLPDCYTLPKSASVNESAVLVSPPPTLTSSASNVSCSIGFNRLNNSCIPRCDTFKLNSDTVTTVLITSEIVAVTVGLITCLLIALCAVPNYKNMLSFPSVFMLLILVDFICAAIVVIISAVNRHGLYCSSTDLLDTLKSPTFFCSLSGVVFHYSLVSMTLWWFMHVTVFFYKVMMPFHARQFFSQDRNRRLTFTVLTLTGFLLPMIPVIVVLATDGYQLSRFPPSLCTPDGGKFFYSASLIINVLLCTGVCFLIGIFWIIHTNRHFRAKREKNSLSTAEKKIMLVFIWFTIFGVFVMIQSGIHSAHSNDLVSGLTQYLACESIGDPQTICNRDDYEKYTHPYLLMVTYILLGLIPVSILNFVVNVRLIKAFVKKCCKSGRMMISGSEYSTASTNLSTGSRTNELKTRTTELTL